MSNFGQYIFTVPKEQQPIVAKLSKTWDKLKSNQRALTQVEVRRTLGIMETPMTVTIPSDHPQYAAILALGEKSTAHVARFEAQAEKARINKRARALIKDIAELLGN